jgi:hypothetical protein
MIAKEALVALAAVLQFVAANVEKTIFLGPEPITIPTQKPTIVDLQLDTLSPGGDTSLRTHIPAQFPTETKPRGEAYWFVLEDLTPGQRYEVRVCWAATVRLLCLRAAMGERSGRLRRDYSNPPPSI